jgi:signal transduction histidine kinase/ActR/RegA family two-component response regulator
MIFFSKKMSNVSRKTIKASIFIMVLASVLVVFYINKQTIFLAGSMLVLMTALLYWYTYKIKKDLLVRIKKKTLALAQISERFEIAVRVAKMGVWVWDLRSNSLTWNEGMFLLYDVSRDQFKNVYKEWGDHIHPEDRLRAETELNDAVNNNSEFQSEFRIIVADGSVRYIRASAFVSKDEQGMPYEVVGLNWDVSDEYLKNKIIEEKLNTANEVIKQTQSELFQSQKMEALGQLAGGIAHDFNNLIGGILGYSAMLRKKYETMSGFEDETRKLSLIQKAAERARDLTKALLGFARKGNYEKIVFNLNETIIETINLLTRTIKSNINLSTQLDNNLWNVKGDSTQILQVLMNMGLNAQYAIHDQGDIVFKTQNIVITKENHVSIKLTPGQYVLVIISDSGCGMSKETVDKIFDPFYTTKPMGEGTGLGLSLSYGIIENHGGAILVDSALNRGSVFSIYLPAINNGCTDSVKKTKEQGLETWSFEQSILIVDDDLIMLEMLGDMIKSGKNKVYLASGGKEAIAIFHEHYHHIGLVFLDFAMPDVDGMEVYRELSKMAPSIKVIFLSGYAQAESISDLRSQGRVGFIQKPFTNEELAICIRDTLDLDK